MRLATWNINGMKARLDYLLHYLREVQPDLIGLQELKMVDESFPRDALQGAGYEAITHGQKSWNGVAVLGRIPMEPVQVGLPSQEHMGARLLSVRAGGLEFTSVYCPNGKTLEHADFACKLAWLDTLAAHFEERCTAGADLVLCGDFNVVPAPIDSWDEATLGGGLFHTEEERSRVGRLLECGFRDAFREAHPEDPGHSWWDYRGGAFHKRQGLRIDLLFATPAIAQRVTGAHVERRWRKKIDGLTPSDHAPVWLDLD